MSAVLVACAVAIALGVALGSWLARRGVTADNALEGRQRGLYLGLLAIALPLVLILWLGYVGRDLWIPMPIVLAVGAYFDEALVLTASFGLGLLLALEGPAWRDRGGSPRENRQRRRQAFGAIVVLVAGLLVLFYWMRPVLALVGAPKEVGPLVFQTTRYSCAAAAIATLGRLTDTHPNLTERAAVELAGTNHFGTSTLGELRALKALNLEPAYRRGATLADLQAADRLALLHVKEPIGDRRVGHAVVLLAVDPEAEAIFILNPRLGLQVKQGEELDRYWPGEVIFVGRSRLRAFPETEAIGPDPRP